MFTADRTASKLQSTNEENVMSLKSVARVAVPAMLAAFALAAAAQQPNPMDVVRTRCERHPYGAPIALDHAQAAINAAVAESKKRGWKLNVAVVDSGGNLVAFQRMDGAQIASIAISEHKARAAATFRRETKAFEAEYKPATTTHHPGRRDRLARRYPLLEGGKLIGAIGCSGARARRTRSSAGRAPRPSSRGLFRKRKGAARPFYFLREAGAFTAGIFSSFIALPK